jgi:hypothetical protein
MVYFLEMQWHTAQTIFERMGRETPALMDGLVAILPPFHLLTPTTGLPEGMALWHVVGYGVGLVTVAMLILVTRPLGSGGRA